MIKNLSIKIFFACAFVCVSAVCVFAECPIEKAIMPSIELIQRKVGEGDLKGAEDFADKVIKGFPECFIQYLERAKVRVELKRFDDARKDLQVAFAYMRLEPNADWLVKIDKKYRAELALTWTRLELGLAIEAKNKKKFKECVEQIDNTLRAREKLPILYLTRADCNKGLNKPEAAEEDTKTAMAQARETKNFDGLLDYFNKQIESEPNNSIGYRRRCEVYNGMDKLQLAFDDCSKALSMDKNSIAYNSNYAIISNRMFRYLNAISAYENIIRIEASNKDSTLDFEAYYGTLGRFQYLNGDFEDAYKSFEKAIEYKENQNSFGVQKYATYQRMQEKFTRIADDKLTEEQILADEQALANARQKYTERKPAEAIQILNEVIKRRPHWAEAVGLRGIFWLPLGQNEKAVSDLELALKLEPWQDHLYLQLARIHQGKDDQKCIQPASRGIELNLGSKNSLLEQRAKCSINTGEFVQAHSDLLTIKTGDNKNRAEDTSDKALEIYAQKNGCGEIPNGTAQDYLARGNKYNNETRDFLCAISDTNRGAKFSNVNKVVFFRLRGIAYLNLSKAEAGIRLKTQGMGGYDTTAFLFQAMRDLNQFTYSEQTPKTERFEHTNMAAEIRSELAVNHLQNYYEKAEMLEGAGDRFGWIIGYVPSEDDRMRENRFTCFKNAATYLFNALNMPKYHKDEKMNKLLDSVSARIVDAYREYKNNPKIAADIEKRYQEFANKYAKLRGADALRKLEQTP